MGRLVRGGTTEAGRGGEEGRARREGRAGGKKVHAYTRTRVKLRFSKNTHKPTIFNDEHPMKHVDVSMKSLKNQTWTRSGDRVSKKMITKFTKSGQTVLSVPWFPSNTKNPLKLVIGHWYVAGGQPRA